MTAGGGAVDQAFIEVELRDNTARSLRDIEQGMNRAGQNSGQNFAQAFGSSVSSSAKTTFGAVTNQAQSAGQDAGRALGGAVASAAAPQVATVMNSAGDAARVAGQNAGQAFGQSAQAAAAPVVQQVFSSPALTSAAAQAGQTSGGAFGGAVAQGAQAGATQAGQNIVATTTDAGAQAGREGGSKLSAGLTGAVRAGGAALATAAATVAAAAAAAVAGAVIAGAKGAFDIAQQANDGLLKIEAQLGVTEAEARKTGEVAKQVFANNWGESLSDAQDMVVKVSQALQGLSGKDLTDATNSAAALADTFDSDVGEQANAAAALMKNFGLTSQQAFDFLAKGYQSGLDRSGDFLDTIGEYSTQFKNGGASADQFFSLLKSGFQPGVLGTDKVADSFKEFVVRIQDGSKSTAQGLESIGINSEKLLAGLADGSITAADAYQTVIGKLKDTKDTSLQMQAGVALIGTQFEDLGRKAVLNLDLTNTKIKDMEGSTAKVQQRYNTLPQLFQGVWRQTLLQLEPVGQQLLKIANDALPLVKSAIQQVGPIMTQVVGGLVAGIGQAKGAFGTVAPVVQQAFAVVRGVIATLAPYIATVVSEIRPVVQSLGPLFGAAFQVVGALWNNVLKPVLTAVAPLFQQAFGYAAQAVRAAVTIITGVVQAVASLLKGDVAGAIRIVEGAFNRGAQIMGEAMQRAGVAILAALGRLPAQLAALAPQIIAGLANGLSAGAAELGRIARNMAGTVIDSFKDVLRIQSPSRVMATLGEFTAEGFVKGITSRNDTVKAAAQGSAKAFLDAFKELNLEREVGKIDLGTYVRTLNEAAVKLRAQIAATKEGTPAYTAYLGALGQVQKALDGLKGKSEGTATAAKKAADGIKDAQAQMLKGEAAEKYARGLDNATDAQLRTALSAARAAGDLDKYNAIRAEQKEREDKVAAALKKSTDAQASAAKQLSDNRAQIAATEAAAAYVASLEKMEDGELKTAAATTRAAGDVTKYNAVRAEQKRRADEVTAAETKARDAARAAAEQIVANRKQIEDGLKFNVYAAGLQGYTDAALEAAQANALAAGDAQKFNAVLAEQKRRADEAGAAIAALVDEQMKAAYTRYSDAQGATDAAYRQSYGAGDAGLIQSLAAVTGLSVEQVGADVDAAITEARRWNADAAAIIERTWADAVQARRDALAETASLDQMATDAAQERARDAAAVADDLLASGNVRGALTALQAAGIAISEQFGDRAGPALDLLAEKINGLDAAVLKLTGDARALANFQIDSDAARRIPEALGDPSAALGPRPVRPATPAAPEKPADALRDRPGKATPQTPSTARGDGSADAEMWQSETRRIEQTTAALEAYRVSLKAKTDAQLQDAAQVAFAAGNEGQYAAIMTEVKTRADAVTTAHKAWTDNLAKIASGEYVEGLKALSAEDLTAALATAQAAENVEQYNAILSEQERRAKASADASKLIADTTAQVAASLGKTELPWEKQIQALEEATGQSKELDAQIAALIARLKGLQAQAAAQQGLEKLSKTIGQVGDIAGKLAQGFGADSSIQQGIGQLTSGVQDGVAAFGKFASGDILGGLQSAFSSLLNIGNAIDNIDPGIKAWKKGLLEVAAIEKEMVGARSYNGVDNPYFAGLTQDAANREKTASAGFWQRLGWSIFGGAPEILNEEAARFQSAAAKIFGDTAQAVTTDLESSLIGAFESGDWTGTEAAMSKSLDRLTAKLALQAIVATSQLEERIKAYAEARATAMQDGVIDPSEQAQLDVLIGNIKGAQRAIAAEFQAVAQRLPGAGSGAPTGQGTPTPSGPGASVQVVVPTVASAALTTDSLASFTGGLERFVPRVEMVGQTFLEVMGLGHSLADRLERLIARADMVAAPQGWNQ